MVLAVAENEELKKRQTEIWYANDEREAELMFSLPTTGRMPEAADELATDTIVLEKLGVPAKLGELVTLKYSIGGEQHSDTFKLVGTWQGDIIMPASQVWLDRTYVEEMLSRYDLRDEEIVGTINADVNFANSWNIESKLQKVITDSGYSLDDISYGVNWAYVGGSSMAIGTVSGLVAVLLMIMLCGYLIISNEFLISVTKDVRFYGLLKTIGTTGKQIKVLIRRQAFLICLMGIPVGLLFGSVIGGQLTPYVMGILNTNVIKVTLSPWIFVFSAFFSLATVFISIQKASRLAAKVSPIEALRVSESEPRGKRKQKRSTTISLWNMAMENVKWSPKKVGMVTLSLSLSLIILNGAYSLANSFNMEEYLSGMISHDFVVGDVSWFNVYATYASQETLDEDFFQALSSQQGIESLERIYFSEKYGELDENWEGIAEQAQETLGISGDYLAYMKEDLDQGTGIYHVYGVDDAVWEDFTLWEGTIDLEKLHSGNYVVVSAYDTEGKIRVYHVGDKVSVFDSDGGSRTCEVLAVADIPYNTSITSVLARRRELAMLQSIGMTVKQQRRMLMTEGLIYTLLTAAFTWTVGTGLGMGALSLLLDRSPSFTILPSVVCMPVLLFLSLLIPALCQKSINRKSVVERMRETE